MITEVKTGKWGERVGDREGEVKQRTKVSRPLQGRGQLENEEPGEERDQKKRRRR